jgi:predicted dehydrogenase
VKRIILVGCGQHISKTLSFYINNLKKINIVALVDIDISSAYSLRDRLGQGTCYRNIFEVAEKYTHAIVALPPLASYEVLDFLIKRKVKIFVEKPPTFTTEQASSLVKLIENHETDIQVGFNFRFSSAFQFIKNEIKEKKEDARICTIDFFSKHPQKGQWEIQSTLESWLRCNGIHAFDLAIWLNGQAEIINSNLISKKEDVFLFNITLRHENGSITILNLGNATISFNIGCKIKFYSGDDIVMNNLNEIQKSVSNKLFQKSEVYKIKNLDNGWERTGYGRELEHFITGVSKTHTPSMQEFCFISKICDEIIKRHG